MITEDYISFETAKLLKEKGFDIPCDNYYDSLGKTPNESVYGGVYIEILDYNADPFVKSGFPKFKTFSAPTQSIAMKWLREIRSIEINISMSSLNSDGSKEYMFDVFFTNERYLEPSKTKAGFKSYEEACEAAIKYCLTNLI